MRKQKLLCLLISFILAWGCLCATSGQMLAYADVRPSDTVAGVPVNFTLIPVDDAPDVLAEYAGLVASDGTVLWERNGAEHVAMASTTKIMTAVIAIENFDPNTPVYVTYGAANTEGTSAGLQEGDTATMRDMLIGLLVPSGNDAAVCIAENVAGTEFAFVDMMNAKAAALGMKNTHFANSHGLDDDEHYTTVQDYYLLTRYAMTLPLFREIVAMREATIHIGGREETFSSTNVLWDYMPDVIGIKTGTEVNAGYCLIAGAARNGVELYAIIFHSGGYEDASNAWFRFEDAQTLLEWGFKHYRQVELINSSQLVGTMGLSDWVDKSVEVYASHPVTVATFDYKGSINQEITLTDWSGAIHQGEKVGSIVWSQNGEILATDDLIAATNEPAPGFFEGLSIWWTRLLGGCSGDAAHQSTEILLPNTIDISTPTPEASTDTPTATG